MIGPSLRSEELVPHVLGIGKHHGDELRELVFRRVNFCRSNRPILLLHLLQQGPRVPSQQHHQQENDHATDAAANDQGSARAAAVFHIVAFTPSLPPHDFLLFRNKGVKPGRKLHSLCRKSK
jgi:hypothetical protein